jgi:hypothetical protein
MDAPHYGRVSQIQTTFFNHFNQISVAQPVTAIPPDIKQDYFTLVMSPMKWVFSRFNFGFHQTSLKHHIFAPQPEGVIFRPKPRCEKGSGPCKGGCCRP